MLLLGAIALALFWLPIEWGIATVAAAALVEIAEVGFWVWLSRRRRPAIGEEALQGTPGVVVTICDPVGEVRVAGELWRARCPEGARPGDRVVVQRLEPGLTLLVAREAREGPE
jgi:membrane protein implicated in regulation of membrane protease activity